MKKSMTRRKFLKGSLAATGLTIVAYTTPGGIKLVNAAEKASAMDGFQPSAFYQITPDNVIKVMVPNSEMGQGVKTALPMIIADELEHRRFAIVVTRVLAIRSGRGVRFFTITPAVAGDESKRIVTKCHHDLAMHAVVGSPPGAEKIATDLSALSDIGRIRRAHGHNAADC